MKCVREISVVWEVVCRILTRARVVFDVERGAVGSAIRRVVRMIVSEG